MEPVPEIVQEAELAGFGWGEPTDVSGGGGDTRTQTSPPEPVPSLLVDADPAETQEWAESLHSVIEVRGPARARFLLAAQLEVARQRGVGFPDPVSTPYVNTIPAHLEPVYPGDEAIERRIRAYLRWNAAAMVLRSNHAAEGLGGHLASYASSAALYETGFNHFFRGKDGHGTDGEPWGDQVFFQGHASPGIYARAYLEGRIGEDRLDNFRRETGGAGLSSYPHPRLMPEFWEFPTVSMGLGPINAVYQARFNRYLMHRGIRDTSGSHVWCFVGDGECDEPESLSALPLAARERLDNLTFVVNCNLQRLDGPVRGNSKVIQELEGLFRGAGWNVIKVIWGSEWDPLLAADTDGALAERLGTIVDGEFQKCTVEGGAYVRERLFGTDERLTRLVHSLTDEQLAAMRRGGHDSAKLYAAYKAAVEHAGAPTAILVKTVKGWGLGPEIEGRNAAHQIKKMGPAQLAQLRDRLGLHDEIPDQALTGGTPPYCRPQPGSAEDEYLLGRRRALGGPLPHRVVRPAPIGQPGESSFASFLAGSGERAVSTTMAFAVLLRSLLRDPAVGDRVVPIIPDEGRTFGMDALFTEAGIYAPEGQLYEPVDAGMQLCYKESPDGQILQEGITEAGALASLSAAGTAYATWAEPMIPFYIFYSMFGFQRTGDAIWAFGDMRGRGFLCGATAGRTTLNGEGLQHGDGHSLLLASAVPNLAAYDPAFAYELAVIISDGIARMYGDKPEDVFYYLTLYNENYPMPAMPSGPAPGAVEEGIVRGLYRFAAASPPASSARTASQPRPATILFSGTAYLAAKEAQDLLAANHGVAAELWSATSYKALREEALSAERWTRLHPGENPRVPWVTGQLRAASGPIVAVTDYMQAVPDQIARWVPGSYTVLGTDGYGRSDTRAALRRHFGTDAAHLVVSVLKALADERQGSPGEVAAAIDTYGIDPDAVESRLA
ncbi:MAG TPA: pyruvate dehydrogenase (acetyl-transferring), homodimeric type [Actinomycetota bacterium]|nr:pyruvate dehydrogenase (acetyl-transferring), homodimeric type [Actinomycetota bacterium]